MKINKLALLTTLTFSSSAFAITQLPGSKINSAVKTEYTSDYAPNDKGNTVNLPGTTSGKPGTGLDGIFLEKTFQQLEEKRIFVNESGRVMVTGLGLLAGMGGEKISLKSLSQSTPVTIQNGEIGGFIRAISNDLKTEEKRFIHAISNDEKFYAAFEIRELKNELSLSPLSEPKQWVALRRINEVTERFWKTLRDVVVQKQGEKAWKTFSSKISKKRLGYRLPQ